MSDDEDDPENLFAGKFLKKFFTAFCSQYGREPLTALKPYMFQPDARKLFATCISAFVVQTQDLKCVIDCTGCYETLSVHHERTDTDDGILYPPGRRVYLNPFDSQRCCMLMLAQIC